MSLYIILQGIFAISLVTAFELPDGCLVRNEISENSFLFDTFDFSVLRGNEISFETNIFLTCDNQRYDHIYLHQGMVTMKRFRPHGDSWNKTFPSQGEIKDWKKFQLDFVKKLALLDEAGKCWLPDVPPMDCPVKHLLIKGGHFIRHCPSETPTWKVENGSEVEIPLLSNQDRQELMMVSLQPYSPKLTICGSEMKLGMEQGKLVTGDSVSPLPSGHQKLFLETVMTDNSYFIKVLNVKEQIIYTAPLKSSPTRLFVKGNKTDKFVIVQQGKGTEPRQGKGTEPGQGNGTEPGQGNGTEPGQGKGTEPGQGNGTEPGQGKGTEPGQGTVFVLQHSFLISVLVGAIVVLVIQVWDIFLVLEPYFDKEK